MALEKHSGFTLLGDIVPNGNWLGDKDAGILIDKTNKKIELWCDGVKVQEFG